MSIIEKQRSIPVTQDCDVCVLGGSCTGVFAAVRAAQLGAKVALIEKQNAFGGVATSGLVAIWHRLKDRDFKVKDVVDLGPYEKDHAMALAESA